MEKTQSNIEDSKPPVQNTGGFSAFFKACRIGDSKQWVVKASGSRGRKVNIAKASYIRLHKEALERGLIAKGVTYSKSELYDILKRGGDAPL